MESLTRRQFTGRAGAATLLAGAGPWPRLIHERRTGAQAAPRPSFVVVIADDLGFGEVGCYGQRAIATPNLDRLALEGIRFTDCYAGGPVCAPSRCSLLTGMHAGHARVRTNYDRLELLPEDVTVAQVLQAAGYRTALIGKWGFGPDDPPESKAMTASHPNAKGFDEFFGYLGHHHAKDYYPDHLWEDDHRVEIPENAPDGPRAQNRFAPDLLTERALEFIARTADAPFLLVLAYNLPHAPNNPPDDGPYADRRWPPGERAHAAQITRLDGYVGQVRAALEAAGAAGRTLVLATSDNGPHEAGGGGEYAPEDQGRTHDPGFFDSNGPLRGLKRSLYEGGIRVPMVAWGPGLVGAPGTTSAVPWAFCDLLPTVAEMAGLLPPRDVDGISRRNAVLGGRSPRDVPLYWFRLDFGKERSQLADAVRLGRWKAVRFTPVGPFPEWRADPAAEVPGPGATVELYDLAADLRESRDVAARHPDVVTALVALMDAAWAPRPYRRRPWVPAPRPGGVPPPDPRGTDGAGARVLRGALAVGVRTRVRSADGIGQRLPVGLASAQPVTDLQATLYRRKGRRRVVVARGSVAVVDGRGAVRLRVLGRIVRRRHVLRLVGRNADGTRADQRFPLWFE